MKRTSFILFLLIAPFAVHSAPFRTVVTTGDIAPYTGGMKYTYFGNRVFINDSGAVAFSANYWDGVGNPGGVFGGGIFTSSALVAQRGGVAPDTGGATIENIGLNGLTNSGNVLYAARLVGPGVDSTNDFGWFDSTGLRLRNGDVAPNTGDATFSRLGDASMDNEGNLTYLAYLEGTGVDSTNDVGIFNSGAPRKIALPLLTGYCFWGVSQLGV